ncbi:MAG: hypothetical protein GAK30_02986 [Paracidovorax wautersii]|uniref:DUF4224 domain-containing protein n=1 Tax=Paracidovorax wautersii TaxID=1177982 RepID=A0A7V8FLZ3_9BURK|nr:MAG: hypothetical protein GAK30_02986 [Paracidovorax wautersii]
MAVASPFLTEAEIDQLTSPVKQHAAQARRLCALLGVKDLPRRPDGLPIVGRALAEERLNQVGSKRPASNAFNWSK